MPWVSSFLKYEWPKVKLSKLLPLNLFLILVENRPAIENIRSESVELAGIDSKADFRLNSLLDSSAVLVALKKSSCNSWKKNSEKR